MAANDELILDLLSSREIISHAQAEEARLHASEKGVDVVDSLAELEIMPEDQVLMLLASEYGMETFDLNGYKIPTEVLEEMPADVARRYKVIPLMINDDTLVVGMSDPTDLETPDERLEYRR